MLNEKKPRWGLILGIGIPAVALVVAALVLLFLFQLPYMQAKNTMDAQGVLVLQEQEDGTVLLQWPAGNNADSYWVTVTAEGETLINALTEQTQYALSGLPSGKSVTIEVLSGCHWRGGIREGQQSLSAQLTLTPPAVTDLEWLADPQTQKLEMTFTQNEDTACQLYTAEGDEVPALLQQTENGAVILTFGEQGDFPVPEYGVQRKFWFAMTQKGTNWEFRGKPGAVLELNREDFLGTGLQLKWERGDSNVYTLSWNETKGERYEIQLSKDGKNWETLVQLDVTQPRTFVTEPLDAFTEYQFRVLALGGQTLPGSEYAAEPAVETVKTAERLLYCTLWPLQDLEVFSDAEMTQSLGKVKGGKALCLLEEKGNAFGVRWENGVGYIDSNYCMINLTEYIGSLCAYNITNSYDSLYMVHEFGIPDVSGEVIKGYEDIQLGENSYVVPLIYPAAQKLMKAAQTALEQGYRLKIYDSYRPQIATLDIYDKASLILADPVPTKTFSGKEVNDLDKVKFTYAPEVAEGETLPPWEGAVEGLTYEILMTDNGRYGLYNFLAKGASNHNRGIAIDLTMETLDGKEVPMQTSIHDLSWYSEVGRNNENARTLRTIMESGGLSGMGSEWWHFQDNETRDNLKPPVLYWGVTMECWVKNSQGWRYRQADCRYVKDCEKTIDKVTYVFDSNGYATAK